MLYSCNRIKCLGFLAIPAIVNAGSIKHRSLWRSGDFPKSQKIHPTMRRLKDSVEKALKDHEQVMKRIQERKREQKERTRKYEIRKRKREERKRQEIKRQQEEEIKRQQEEEIKRQQEEEIKREYELQEKVKRLFNEYHDRVSALRAGTIPFKYLEGSQLYERIQKDHEEAREEWLTKCNKKQLSQTEYNDANHSFSKMSIAHGDVVACMINLPNGSKLENDLKQMRDEALQKLRDAKELLRALRKRKSGTEALENKDINLMLSVDKKLYNNLCEAFDYRNATCSNDVKDFQTYYKKLGELAARKSKRVKEYGKNLREEATREGTEPDYNDETYQLLLTKAASEQEVIYAFMADEKAKHGKETIGDIKKRLDQKYLKAKADLDAYKVAHELPIRSH